MKVCFLWILAYAMAGFVQGQSTLERAQIHYEQAQKAYRVRSYELALAEISESLRYVRDSRAFCLEGMIYEALNQPKRALSSYEAALVLDPAYREAIFQKGLIYLHHGSASQAVTDFTALLEAEGVGETNAIYFQVDPSGLEQTQVATLQTLQGSLYHYRGQAYQKLGEWKLALNDLNAALALDTTAEVLVSRGLLYQQMNNMAHAKADLAWAVTLEPEHQLAWYNLALLDPSVKLPETLLEEAAFAPLLGLLGARALEAGDHQTAITMYRKSLRLDSTDVQSWVNMGRAKMKVKDYSGALANFAEAQRLDPAHLETYYLMGNGWFYLRQFERALAYYNQYLGLDPAYAMVWYNAAMAYLELERRGEACHYLHRAQDLGMTVDSVLLQRHCDGE